MDKEFNLCLDDECPARKKCFRYTAEPIKRGQAFFAELPRIDGDDDCRMFVSNKKRGKRHTFHKRVERIG